MGSDGLPPPLLPNFSNSGRKKIHRKKGRDPLNPIGSAKWETSSEDESDGESGTSAAPGSNASDAKRIRRDDANKLQPDSLSLPSQSPPSPTSSCGDGLSPVVPSRNNISLYHSNQIR